MDVLVVLVTATLASFVIIVIWFLKKAFTPKTKVFPTCRKCGRYMAPWSFGSGELPFEMVAYLNKWNLPELVIRKHICPNNHSTLWIAPPVGDMAKALYVSEQN